MYRIDIVNFVEQERLNTHIAGKTQRLESWTKLQKKVNDLLTTESEEHDDVINLEVIDVYRHLPDKLLASLQWCVHFVFVFVYSNVRCSIR